jgi:hypothetical protein
LSPFFITVFDIVIVVAVVTVATIIAIGEVVIVAGVAVVNSQQQKLLKCLKLKKS